MSEPDWKRGDTVRVDLGDGRVTAHVVSDIDRGPDGWTVTMQLDDPAAPTLRDKPLWLPLSDEMARHLMPNTAPLFDALRAAPLTPGPVVYYDTEDDMPPELRKRLAAERAETARVTIAADVRHTRTAIRHDGVLRAVINAHRPHVDASLSNRTTCGGCDYDPDGYDGGPGAWPCSTFLMIEESP